MKQLNLTGQNTEHEQRRTWARGANLARLAVILILMTFVLGTQRCPNVGNRTTTFHCASIFLIMEPGTCVALQNPCADNQWSVPPDFDGFELCPQSDEERALIAAAGLYIRTERTSNQTTRWLCVGANSPHFAQQHFTYRYGRGPDFDLGDMYLIVSDPFTLEVTASPSTIALGGSSQLLAIVSGGIPPYFYSWVPTGGLNDDDISAPVTTPDVTQTYTVYVRDSSGQYRNGSVTVAVGLDLAVTVDPPVIAQGDASQLNAIASGGSQPYTSLWSPADTLDDATRQDPIARPTTTTTYQVTVTDAAGATRQGSATVTVNSGSPPPTASFVYNVICCPTLNVNASASTGNIVSYTWDLSWTAANPDLVTTSPTAAFTIQEFNRGIITLTVRDNIGRTATTTRNF